MSAVDQPLAIHHDDVNDEHDIEPPKTPDYRPNGDDLELNDQEMSAIMEDYDEENSPPPSQPRPVRSTQYQPKRERENSPPRQNGQNPVKRGQKRKYTDTNAVQAKIAKTEQSIEKLEKHLANRTCPKSLQYTAKPNITPDTTFDREIKAFVTVNLWHRIKRDVSSNHTSANTTHVQNLTTTGVPTIATTYRRPFFGWPTRRRNTPRPTVSALNLTGLTEVQIEKLLRGNRSSVPLNHLGFPKIPNSHRGTRRPPTRTKHNASKPNQTSGKNGEGNFHTEIMGELRKRENGTQTSILDSNGATSTNSVVVSSKELRKNLAIITDGVFPWSSQNTAFGSLSLPACYCPRSFV
ncbi:hypothetical protein ACROYT_G036130 [Oculina patagonica]